MNSALFITWFHHRRTAEICAGLNFELKELVTPQRGVLRYLILSTRTVALLMRRRPDILIVQNPSLILAALAVLLRGLWRYRLVVDAHNEGVEPFKQRQRWILSLTRWVIRSADLTIVTNRYLADLVTEHRGRPFVLPDRVPNPPSVPLRPLQGVFNVVLISTFDPDEPCAEVLAAVQGTDIDLYVTGDAQKLDSSIAAALPQNVHLTGFLDELAYWSLLKSADAIADLTTKNNCLVCGSYEALAVSKPMLLSDNAASRELFGDCAVFTNNSRLDISRALVRLRADRAYIAAAARVRRVELAEQWSSTAQELLGLLATVARAHGPSPKGASGLKLR